MCALVCYTSVGLAHALQAVDATESAVASDGAALLVIFQEVSKQQMLPACTSVKQNNIFTSAWLCAHPDTCMLLP
jgi:hypothetical protein